MVDRTSRLKSEARTVIGETTAEQWLWSPDHKTWNMALILEHLNSVGRQGLPGIEAGVARIREEHRLSDSPPAYGMFERFFIRLLSPNPPFRVPVPSIYVPAICADPGHETAPHFLEMLERTLVCLNFADGHELKAVKMPSPANPRLRLTVGAWLEGIVAHNDYHWGQVRALRVHAAFPRGRPAQTD